MEVPPPFAIIRLHRLLENEGFLKTWPLQYAASFAGGGIALLGCNWVAVRFIESVPVRFALEFVVALTGMALSERFYQQVMFKYTDRPVDAATKTMSALSSKDRAALYFLLTRKKDDWKETQKFVRQHEETIHTALVQTAD